MFYWHDRRDLSAGNLERCFTDARSGVSEAPFSTLNLGLHVGDDDAKVHENRRLVSQALGGAPIVWMNQVHGHDVVEVDGGALGAAPTADAMVSREPGLALGVMVADCVPVLLEDAEAGVVGVAHAGRPGMLAGVVPAVVEAMRDLGAAQVRATLGPSVCGRCYEVPQGMYDEARAKHPASAAITWSGTYAIDVASGVASQLRDLDVPFDWVGGCTVEDEHLYSYRRDGRTGRFAGVIVRREHRGRAR